MTNAHFACGTNALACIILSALLLGCETRSDGSNSTSGAGDSLLVELTGVDSISVLDLLAKEHSVDCVRTVIGVYVKAIDSVENGPGVYWLYSINDTMAQVAADRYITSNGDRIRWHFRRWRK